MDPPRREVHFPRNTSPAADAPWNVTAFPAPQHPQSAHLSDLRPVPGQRHGHAGVARFPSANAAGNHWSDEDWEDMPPPVENYAAQRQPQNLQYLDTGYYDMANVHPPVPPLHEHRDQAIDNYAAVVRDAPAPPAPNDLFDGPARNATADPAPNRPSNEVLRQLAILYLREPNSQVTVIRMEPGGAHGVKVSITLELANL